MPFVLFLRACTAVSLHPTARLDSLGDLVSMSHLPSASTGHVGCCVICPLCHQEVWCLSSPAVCIARVLLLPWHLAPFTSWTLHFMNCIYKLSNLNFAGTGCPILSGLCTCICERIRSLFFPLGVFRVLVSGRYTSNQCQPITGLSKIGAQ